MKSKPKVMPGFEAEQKKRLEGMAERRWHSPLMRCRRVVEDTAKRIEESKKLFPWRFFRGDCHCHTQHSDGIGTVEESAEMAKAAGLDFLFVTDHWGVTQAPECRKLGVWCGQEPGTQHHHMGILGLDHAFTPAKDLLADFTEARRRGGTVYIPHPAGWWPTTVYSEEKKQALYCLPDPFLMEVINGACNIVRAFDYTDELAVELWDKMLTDGRHIHAMANTDAHTPHGIGMCWSGVLAARCDQDTILRALGRGKAFATEAPLLNLMIGRTGMGSRVPKGARRAPLKLTVVDSRGLLRVRLVADGKVRRTWLLDGDRILARELPLQASWKRYVRVEAISLDGRRGFSNPVYLA